MAKMSRLETSAEVPYKKLYDRLSQFRKAAPKKLTLAEKIIISHLDDPLQLVKVLFNFLYFG